MHIKKPVAMHTQEFLGDFESVINYYNDDKSKSIELGIVPNSLGKGIKSVCTIGLSKTNINKVSREKKLRVELLSAAYDNDNEVCENIISTIAFDIMDLEDCKPDFIIKNTVSIYKKDTDMKHILLYDPFLWETSILEVEDLVVTWLLLIPISNDELEYVDKFGIEKLIDLFDEKSINIFDINRKSVI